MFTLPYDFTDGKQSLASAEREMRADGRPGRYKTLYLYWCSNCGTKKCICGTALAGPIYQHSDTAASITPLYGLVTTRRWGVRGKGKPEDLLGYAKLFYGLLAADAATGGRFKATITTPKIKEIAETLARATVMSCLGEARYHVTCVAHDVLVSMENAAIKHGRTTGENPVTITDLQTMIRDHTRLGWWAQDTGVVLTGYITHRPHVTRNRAVGNRRRAFIPLNVIKEYASIAKTVHGMHVRLHGDELGGVGGPLWNQGAQLVWQWFKGNVPDVAFVDQVFDLIHNGGALLNKVLYCNDEAIQVYLDWRKNADVDEILAATDNEILGWYELPQRETSLPGNWIPEDIWGRLGFGCEPWKPGNRYGASVRKEPEEMLQPGAIIQWWRGLTSQDITVIPYKTWNKHWETLRHSANIGYSMHWEHRSPYTTDGDERFTDASVKIFRVELPSNITTAFSSYYRYLKIEDYSGAVFAEDGHLVSKDGNKGNSRNDMRRTLWAQVANDTFREYSAPALIEKLHPTYQKVFAETLKFKLVPHETCPSCRASEHNLARTVMIARDLRFQEHRRMLRNKAVAEGKTYYEIEDSTVAMPKALALLSLCPIGGQVGCYCGLTAEPCCDNALNAIAMMPNTPESWGGHSSKCNVATRKAYYESLRAAHTRYKTAVVSNASSRFHWPATRILDDTLQWPPAGRLTLPKALRLLFAANAEESQPYSLFDESLEKMEVHQNDASNDYPSCNHGQHCTYKPKWDLCCCHEMHHRNGCDKTCKCFTCQLHKKAAADERKAVASSKSGKTKVMMDGSTFLSDAYKQAMAQDIKDSKDQVGVQVDATSQVQATVQEAVKAAMLKKHQQLMDEAVVKAYKAEAMLDAPVPGPMLHQMTHNPSLYYDWKIPDVLYKKTASGGSVWFSAEFKDNGEQAEDGPDPIAGFSDGQGDIVSHYFVDEAEEDLEFFEEGIDDGDDQG